MRQAAFDAPLGDDVYGEDPTVNRLEALSADMLGKEAACLMPSGTMANLTAILAHCPRGSEVLVGDESDIYHYEAGGASVVGGIVYHAVPTRPDGSLACTDLRAAIRDPRDSQFAQAALICLENSHNRCGGAVLSLDYLAEVRAFADAQSLPIHMDGARVFNAAVALGVPVATITRYADSVQFCLSKGLSAPIGSMIAGSQRLIDAVRRLRKMLGGGMRQAGMIAAPGITALETMVDRLADDHRRARQLATGLAALPGITLDLDRVQTNIILFEVTDPRYPWEHFLTTLEAQGVRMSELGYGRVRAVTHYGISDEDIEQTLSAVQHILQA